MSSTPELLDSLIPANEDTHWMRALVNLGAFLASADASPPLSVAVCLPRVEFAALLVASGACLHAAYVPPTRIDRETYQDLVGKRIAYSLRGNQYVYWEGILCEPAPNDAARLRVQGSVNGLPHIWELSDLTSIKLDPERTGQPLGLHDIGKTGFTDEHCKNVRTIMTKHAAGTLCSWWHRITIAGTKGRLAEELQEIFPQRANPRDCCAFVDLVRPEGFVRDSAITRLLSSKDLTAGSAAGIVIIEGSRRVSEHFFATQNQHRVFLLGRNEPHYSDCAEVVMRNFQNRGSDPVGPTFDWPEHMKFKIFSHCS